MKKTLKTFSVFLLASCLFTGGCQNAVPAFPDGQAACADTLRILTIGTADSGGTMYPAGKAIAQVIEDSDSNMKINLNASNGSSSNVRSLESGDIDLGLVSGDIAFLAVNGQGEFAGEPFSDLRAIAAVYSSLSNWMALSASGLTYVHDLKGKRLGIGPQDSTTEIAASIVLDSMGITDSNSTLINCGLGAGAEKVKNKTLDAVCGFTGIPINSMAELSKEEPTVLLKFTQKELLEIIQNNPSYYTDVIPAGTYEGQEEDIPTFGIKCLLCVRADMDEKLVYELTSILFEHVESLEGMHSSLSAMKKNGFMYEDLPIALHPGAERFYLEKGLLPANP